VKNYCEIRRFLILSGMILYGFFKKQEISGFSKSAAQAAPLVNLF
jgi:hypothetical protein